MTPVRILLENADDTSSHLVLSERLVTVKFALLFHIIQSFFAFNWVSVTNSNMVLGISKHKLPVRCQQRIECL